MNVETVADVDRWLASWGGRPRPGILAAVIAGQRMRLSLMRSNPGRYAPETLAGAAAVLARLEACR